jgi:hypothetical protein
VIIGKGAVAMSEVSDVIDNLTGELERFREMHAETLVAQSDERNRFSARIRELESQLANAGMPCDCWDSRCAQYAILLRRASFLMQTAAKGDADMRKFIDEIERLCGSPSTSKGVE